MSIVDPYNQEAARVDPDIEADLWLCQTTSERATAEPWLSEALIGLTEAS
jgi:hypothetical protein